VGKYTPPKSLCVGEKKAGGTSGSRSDGMRRSTASYSDITDLHRTFAVARPGCGTMTTESSMCIITTQLDTKSNPNRHRITKQHAVVSIQLYVVSVREIHCTVFTTFRCH